MDAASVVEEEDQEHKLPEVPGIHQTHQRPVVTATIDMEQTLGTAWHLSLAHGSASARLGLEGPAGLARKTKLASRLTKLITTLCSHR